MGKQVKKHGYSAKLLRVVDGDTADAMIDLGFNTWVKKRIRFYGVDTWESRTRDLEDQKFGGDTGTDADFNIGQSEEIDGAYTAEEFEEWEEAVKKEETKFDPEKKYIFESPDGGETVYRREFGSDERVKIKIEEMEK